MHEYAVDIATTKLSCAMDTHATAAADHCPLFQGAEGCAFPVVSKVS